MRGYVANSCKQQQSTAKFSQRKQYLLVWTEAKGHQEPWAKTAEQEPLLLLPVQGRLQASDGLRARAMSTVSLLRPALSICFLVPPQNQQCNCRGEITEGHLPTFRMGKKYYRAVFASHCEL